jgi:hypothetical protein
MIYLKRTLGSVSQALAVVTNRHTSQASSLVPMTLPTTRALSPSIQLVPWICLEQSMRDGVSVLLTRWSELGTKLSEFRQLITLEGNQMNVAIYKKVLSDFQLEWEKLNKNQTSYWNMNNVIRESYRDLVLLFVFQIVIALIVHLGYNKAKMEWQVRIHLASPQ